MRQSTLEFSKLGATRRMTQQKKKGKGRRNTDRVRMMIVDFLFMRILVGMVIYEPWNCGLGRRNPPKQVMTNLKMISSALYYVCREAYPKFVQPGVTWKQSKAEDSSSSDDDSPSTNVTMPVRRQHAHCRIVSLSLSLSLSHACVRACACVCLRVCGRRK